MATFLLDGAAVSQGVLGTNDGLNYGRFDVPGLSVYAYEVQIGIDEILHAASDAFDELLEEMKVDDRLDPEPSALMRMGYPTLREAFRYPAELREVIEIFMHRDILIAFAPYTAQSDYIINSTDAVRVQEVGISIAGRCFARPWPRPP